MGNARSSARRSVHVLSTQDDVTSSFEEPLLDAASKQLMLLDDASRRRRQRPRRSLPSDDAWVPHIDLPAAIRQLNCFYAVVCPVVITMLLTSNYMYYQDIDASDISVGQKSMLAFCNALFVIGFIACLTFAIVLLYKFNCMSCFLGYCVVYSASLLGLAGSNLVLLVFGQRLHVIIDCYSLAFVMYNFAVVGILSIFYQKGIPRILEQGYLVVISVIVGWQFAQLPEWSVWMILLLLGFWDIFAVLSPVGPLRWLVDLVQEKGTPLPGLLFQADIQDAHRSPVRPWKGPSRGQIAETDFIKWLLSRVPTTPYSTKSVSRDALCHEISSFLGSHAATTSVHHAAALAVVYERHAEELWHLLRCYYTPPAAPLAVGQPTPNADADADADEGDKSIKLGLGDFIFYSVLVARAALHSFLAFAVCSLLVTAGLAITMFLLARFDALPALPISIFSGIAGYVISVELLAPLVDELTCAELRDRRIDAMIDPSKDKFAYFKDNIQTAEDKEFDASQYYYHREELSGKSAAGIAPGPGGAALNLASFHGGMSGVDESNAQQSAFYAGAGGVLGGAAGTSQFLGSAGARVPLGGGALPHELHRMNSSDLGSVMKSRSYPGPGENKAPDMSEFPALGSRSASWTLDQGENAAAAASRSQGSEFVIQKEDFPALSSFGGPNSNDKASMQQDLELKRHSSFTASASDSLPTRRPSGSSGSTSSIGSRAGLGSAAGGSNVNLGATGAFGPLHGSRPAASGASNGQLDPSNKFGLLGMLHTVIRPSHDAKKNLMMGCDLTSLGLNLNSAEPLHPVFASPWADGPLTKEPQFTLPLCYYNQPPALKTTHLSKFHLETLFYIFYAMPRDVLQAYAAQELYNREWRYHGELSLWLKRASVADAALVANGSALSSAAAMGAMGPQFLYFDTTTWERRVFTGNIHSLAAGLLSEEEIRVKFNAAS
ncbi:hypothetical protein P43SY_007069 [Pythium insidiosum]|uniref:NOT2/NOT3/NOT5 C-terminal domain-containing protein n=1 Tax=Pythium insidiosum TaxID=114742 RepID=A0AAD5M6G8_PYTIN|nr:hypothetical protein P43SY_007069 [Pythium insidiosum]